MKFVYIRDNIFPARRIQRIWVAPPYEDPEDPGKNVGATIHLWFKNDEHIAEYGSFPEAVRAFTSIMKHLGTNDIPAD